MGFTYLIPFMPFPKILGGRSFSSFRTWNATDPPINKTMEVPSILGESCVYLEAAMMEALRPP